MALPFLAHYFSLGLLSVCFQHLRFPAPGPSIDIAVHQQSYAALYLHQRRYQEFMFFSAYQQWPETLSQLRHYWSMTRTSSAFIVMLAIGLLQIEGAMPNVPARTLTLTALVLAGSNLIASNIFIWLGPGSDDYEWIGRWMKASENLAERQNVAFWLSVIHPLVCLLYSIILCSLTIPLIAWVPDDNENSSETTSVAGTFFVAASLLGGFLQIGWTVKSVVFSSRRREGGSTFGGYIS